MIEIKDLRAMSDYEIAKLLGVDFSFYNLNKIPSKKNTYMMKDNMIYLYPPNDGLPLYPFAFCKDKKIILNNQSAFQQITNLDEILLEIVDIMNKGLDNNIIIDSYCFMLQLTDEIKLNYEGKAKLFITDAALRCNRKSINELEELKKRNINQFLDCFIGWNFGVSVNRNEKLREELEKLNEKVIDMGIRRFEGRGLSVKGLVNEPINGLQHYIFKTEKEKIKQKIYNE